MPKKNDGKAKGGKPYSQAFRIGTLTITFACDAGTNCDINTLVCDAGTKVCGPKATCLCSDGHTCGAVSCEDDSRRDFRDKPEKHDRLKGFPELAELAASMVWMRGDIRKGIQEFREKVDDRVRPTD